MKHLRRPAPASALPLLQHSVSEGPNEMQPSFCNHKYFRFTSIADDVQRVNINSQAGNANSDPMISIRNGEMLPQSHEERS